METPVEEVLKILDDGQLTDEARVHILMRLEEARIAVAKNRIESERNALIERFIKTFGATAFR